MTSGSGSRSVEKQIKFDTPFSEIPEITSALGELDTQAGLNYRIICRTKNVNKDGFTMEINTWANTKIYSAVCSWLAHGF